MGSSHVGRAVLVGGVVGAIFGACAQGNEFSGAGGGGGSAVTGSPSSSTSGKPDSGPSKGQIGSPCMSSSDCEVGMCSPIGTTKYCTTSCPPACPGGTYCSLIDGFPLCVPDLGQQCDTCKTAANCKLPSDACLTAPLGDQFCAEDCTIDGLCPNGFVCKSMTAYEADGGVDGGGTGGGSSGTGGAATSGTGGTGGTSTGGSGGASGGGPGAGGTSASTGGSGGAPTQPTSPNRWCVPNAGLSCPCNTHRNGVTNACEVTNTNGTCKGKETCDGETGQWKGCTAKTPKPESCNGEDDDCDGLIDEGDPNMLCAFKGAPPANGNWACANSKCQLGSCNPGFTDYPSDSTGGCTCPVNATEPDATCATATDMGMVSSTVGSPITLQGTLSSDTDVNVYTFNTVDVNEMITNSYHVAIAFTKPSPNNEFIMDVERGGACSDAPSGGASAITSYDWCVNASNGTMGEAPCGPTGPVACADHSSTYFVRVYRKPGVKGTCTPYTIAVSGGGGTCDLTATCM